MVKKNILFSAESLAVFLLTASFSQIIFPQNTAEQIVSLEINKPFEREIAGGGQDNFQIDVAAGQYAKIIVEQRGINLFARLTGADGKTVVEADAEIENTGAEIVEIYTAADGLRLSVAARNKNAPRAAYKIELVERREPTAKETALQEARTLINKAIELWLAGKYSEAKPVAERGLAIRERAWGAENFEVAQAYFVLGNIVGDMGDLAKNEKFYERALEIAEKTLGKDNLYISAILNNWGVIYKLRGDYIEAEEFYLRALRIREKLLDRNHLQIAQSLNNLAGIYSARGDKQKAAEFYRRALTIRENALGAEHPQVAVLLNNLAGEMEDLAAAEGLYLRSLAILEKTLGAEHQDAARTLYNLGWVYSAAGDYAKAEAVTRRALEIYQKALGAEHQFISYPLNLLGAIYKFRGDYDQAETFLLRAAALKEKTQSPLHPELGGTLSLLAGVYALKGDIEKAVVTQTRANEILEYNTLLNLRIGSEREKLGYLQTLETVNSDTMTLYFRSAEKSKAARELALTAVLRRKGRVLDAMSDGFTALRRRAGAADQKLFDDLNRTTTDLVGFITTGGENRSPDEYRRELKTLEEKRETIENQISRRSAGYYEKSSSVTLDNVRALIPENAALIEFTVYRPVSLRLSGFGADFNSKAFEEPRYAAFIVGANGTTNAGDLGTVREIDALADDLRQSLRDPNTRDAKKKARLLDEKLMQPLRALTGGAEHLLISPDGGLNLIPFEALVNEKGNYLVERYAFTYLSSGRDLLRMQNARRANVRKPLVVANPNFGTFGEQTFTAEGNGKNKRRSITAARNLSDTYFAPLAATLQEARVIQNEFPDALVLTGAAATETALKQTNAPLLLHIATHGFFLEDGLQSRQTENPLLRSGIALAGANLRESKEKDDGILTALEASGLNLWGTKLVVLSGCDTGLGEVKNGEGVYGLRRAFVLAGTESLVMSLWSVSDFVTRELMTNYYKNLKSKTGRGAALRQAQLEMMKKREHPFYWAAFIQSGEWANLDGRR